MAVFTYDGYHPRPGDYVEGKYGKHRVRGIVLGHPERQGQAWIFSRFGFVACYILSENGRRMAVNEIRKI